ncbi:MAG: glycosyltransferase family 4 protein [Gammaproteobacteria bacterium]|nr:glycosyltransferase family 4 protein [Gammaproteobacteria bacterium]
MRVAFYAPLKSPTHPVPSGDRQIAQAFVRALGLAGCEVEVASNFRSFDGAGNGARQARLQRIGARLAARLVRRMRALPIGRRPQAWFTYHLYHKAPDWLSPTVSRALGIPYIVAEASHSTKQRFGPWREGYAASVAAIHEANAVLSLNSDDVPGLRQLVPAERLHTLRPFLDLSCWTVPHDPAAVRSRLAEKYSIDREACWLCCVAMMRHGRKADSYFLLSEALSQLDEENWRVFIVGDGDARADIEAAFAPHREKVVFTGRLEGLALRECYVASDIFVWPALAEPLGMTFIEAQSLGLPVVAGRTRGVVDMVAENETGLLVEEGQAQPFAQTLSRLIWNDSLRTRLGEAARPYVMRTHDVTAAATRLNEILRTCVSAQPLVRNTAKEVR